MKLFYIELLLEVLYRILYDLSFKS